MKKVQKMNRIVMLLLFVLFCVTIKAFAQSSQEIEQTIKQLQSENWLKREEAANTLAGLQPELRTDKVMNALVGELERCGKKKKGMGEGETEYCVGLSYSVAILQDDRAFSYFVRLGDPVALLKYGDKGVKTIVEQLDRRKSCAEKIMVVDVLGDAVNQGDGRYKKKGYVAQGTVKEGVKKALIKILRESKNPDKNIEWFVYRANDCAVVRKRTAKALSYLAESGDTDVLPIIESMAKDDSYYWVPEGKPDEESNRKYDVREEAQKVIDELKAKGIKK